MHALAHIRRCLAIPAPSLYGWPHKSQLHGAVACFLNSPASHYYSGFPDSFKSRLKEANFWLGLEVASMRPKYEKVVRDILVEAQTQLVWMDGYPNRNAVAIAMWRYGKNPNFKAKQLLFLTGDPDAQRDARAMILAEYPL